MMNGNGVADFNSFIFYLIGSSEGFEPQIYWPPNDVPTIGYGESRKTPTPTPFNMALEIWRH